MKMRSIDVPEEMLELLKKTKLASCDEAEQVRVALAAFLFQQRAASTGKATRLSGMPRADFELLLGELGIPPVRYDVEDYRQDIEAIERAEQRARLRQQSS